MEISNLRVSARGEDSIIAANVLTNGQSTTLWYSLPTSYTDYIVTDRYDAFVVAMLPLAMRNRENLIVKGMVSEKLYYGLAHHYMQILRMANSRYHEISIVPDSLANARYASATTGVACGISGGVDSLYTIKLHTSRELPPRFRLTHLLFNNVGAHGQQDLARANKLFEERLAKASAFARDIGLELITVNSNLDQTLAGVSFTQTHTLRNISVALLLQKLISKFLYSSGVLVSEQGVKADTSRRGTRFHDYLDSQTVHLLSTENTDCILVGAEVGRIEKLEAIKDDPLAHKHLTVCTKSSANCGVCKKCLLTLSILEAIGCLKQFGGAFDLEEYRRNRTKHIIFDVLGRPGDVAYGRILSYRRSKKLKYSLAQRIAGALVSLSRRTATILAHPWYR